MQRRLRRTRTQRLTGMKNTLPDTDQVRRANDTRDVPNTQIDAVEFGRFGAGRLLDERTSAKYLLHPKVLRV